MSRLFVAVATALLGLAPAVAGARSEALVPRSLVGSYEALLPEGHGTQSGRWVLAVGRRGAFVLTTPRLSPVRAGPASVSGNTLTLPPDAARGGACAGPGIYTWRLSGLLLRFALVDDACRSRAFLLTARAWKRFTSYEPVVIVRR